MSVLALQEYTDQVIRYFVVNQHICFGAGTIFIILFRYLILLSHAFGWNPCASNGWVADIVLNKEEKGCPHIITSKYICVFYYFSVYNVVYFMHQSTCVYTVHSQSIQTP